MALTTVGVGFIQGTEKRRGISLISIVSPELLTRWPISPSLRAAPAALRAGVAALGRWILKGRHSSEVGLHPIFRRAGAATVAARTDAEPGLLVRPDHPAGGAL